MALGIGGGNWYVKVRSSSILFSMTRGLSGCLTSHSDFFLWPFFVQIFQNHLEKASLLSHVLPAVSLRH